MTEAPAAPRYWTERELQALDRSPERGWVPAYEVFHCDACDLRRWYWELHHLDPVGWGGSDSRRLPDRQIVWVRVCGDCHSTAHMILDTFKAAGAWSEEWLAQMDLPHYYVEVARRGWQLYQRRLALALPAGTEAS
jgi:hypothetical protein